MLDAIRLLVTVSVLLRCIDGETGKDACWSSSTSYQISSLDNNLVKRESTVTELELVEECHLSFVRMIVNKTCSAAASSLKQPTLAQKYGYGFLAVFIISILSLAGFVAFPLMRKPYYKYINAFFIALAVGTLYADLAFELFPVIIQFDFASSHVHEHGRLPSKNSSKGPIKVPLFLWQMTALVLTSYVFYVVELLIHGIMHRSHHHGPAASGPIRTDLQSIDVSAASSESLSKTDPDSAILPTKIARRSIASLHGQATTSTGWMIIIGDGIHNIADGLAIGAAFAENAVFGVTTTIAIACHELPTELGEYMVLIESGFTFRKALLFNFISACTAIAGFFVGASIAQNESARVWIFVVTAGTFTYIALVDLWPTLMPLTEKFDWIRFACVTAGYLLGVLIMFILTIFEDRIVQGAGHE